MLQTNGKKGTAGGKGIIIGFLAATLTALLLISLISLIMTVKDFSGVLVTVASYLVLSLSSFLGGWIGCKIMGKQGMKNGAMIGGCLFGAIFVCGVTLNGIPNSILFIGKLVCCVLSGMIGGILGVNITRKNKFNV